MLMNATLLRIDDPPPAAPGDGLSIRCSVGSPTTAEQAFLGAMSMSAARVLYLSMGTAEPATGQQVVVQVDGCPVTTWGVVYVADHVGGVMSHLQVFLEAV